MRLDYLTIFPDYLAPLQLSLPGKAIASGLLELHVHDLRTWTHDRHRTVDDTPYGGGAGMVMRPEPYGAAFDELGLEDTTVIVTSPSGEPLTQPLARELATRSRLLFLIGRYEGIDQRVIDHTRERTEVREISLGDYVLNGGEVAALAITEAVVRLLPGFMGNAASLVEESHEDGLLEYPVYTKPQQWRGHEVPPVLLSGDHGRIAAWRHQRRLERTAERRPDLLHPSAAATEWQIERAGRGDAGELMTLMRACWSQVALEEESLEIPALHESYEQVVADLGSWETYVVRAGGRLVGSVRGRLIDAPDGEGRWWDIGRLCVAPDLQGRGLGRALLEHIERVAAPQATAYWLFTGANAHRNQRLYKRAGFRLRPDLASIPGTVVLTKRRRPE
ncbi:tRNA (guanosine(37)-N1)-methyltransferase TrmD [Nocardioides sp. BP30]|uniref:tRNA (guanosine(37)-N1)-methyltransferase TrmD n=1 Tax=Nocardioides sp. BP30 TaxID=3036374 RepID=UPI0024693AFA|nr:tRNA (guanosine(37)-N1)-methyltransferase TrmD [Nocardioides sp. BP30]WGL53710.1 tRNA (guanosine(37)-N1)-methyltransferase TrmD [Nocardioides sp. BP30]